MENKIFNIKKVQKRSAEVQAADLLREAIINGNIPLGSRLTELHSAEQLGVARSTIRTAFHQLVQEGLIIQVPYTGWTVMTLSAQDAWELYTLRSSLEALAARLVAENIRNGKSTWQIRSQLTDAFNHLKEACTSLTKKDIAEADFSLHKTIVFLSEHSRLIDQYARIEHQILIYIKSSDSLITEPLQIIEQHEPQVIALLEGDVEKAVSLAVEHNESEGKILLNHLNN